MSEATEVFAVVAAPGPEDPDSALPYVVLVYVGEGGLQQPMVKAYTAMDQMIAHDLATVAADCGRPAFLVDLWGEADGPTIERYESLGRPSPPTRRPDDSPARRSTMASEMCCPPCARDQHEDCQVSHVGHCQAFCQCWCREVARQDEEERRSDEHEVCQPVAAMHDAGGESTFPANPFVAPPDVGLEEALEEAQLRSIEARNPGIDMADVRRLRTSEPPRSLA